MCQFSFNINYVGRFSLDLVHILPSSDLRRCPAQKKRFKGDVVSLIQFGCASVHGQSVVAACMVAPRLGEFGSIGSYRDAAHSNGTESRSKTSWCCGCALLVWLLRSSALSRPAAWDLHASRGAGELKRPARRESSGVAESRRWRGRVFT
jgi:hypothetical protein